MLLYINHPKSNPPCGVQELVPLLDGGVGEGRSNPPYDPPFHFQPGTTGWVGTNFRTLGSRTLPLGDSGHLSRWPGTRRGRARGAHFSGTGRAGPPPERQNHGSPDGAPGIRGPAPAIGRAPVFSIVTWLNLFILLNFYGPCMSEYEWEARRVPRAPPTGIIGEYRPAPNPASAFAALEFPREHLGWVIGPVSGREDEGRPGARTRGSVRRRREADLEPAPDRPAPL